MSEVEKNDVLARLEKVERENRILKRCVALVALALGAVFAMAQAPGRPRTLEAERLVIRYPNGKEAITLGTGPSSFRDRDGGLSAQAEFINYAGSVETRITADPNNGEVRLISPKEQLQMGMSAGTSFSGPGFPTSDGDYVDLFITRQPKEQPFLPIPMLDIEANTRGEIKERMWNEKGPDGGILQLTNGPDGPAVQLWDNLKIVRAVFGNTRLNPIRSGSVETRALSSLVLFDKDGQVLWQAP